MQFLPSGTFPTLATPLFMERVQAGFPSPAQGYEQKAIDLNALMVVLSNNASKSAWRSARASGCSPVHQVCSRFTSISYRARRYYCLAGTDP